MKRLLKRFIMLPVLAVTLLIAGTITPAHAATVDSWGWGAGSCTTTSYGDTSSYGYNWSVVNYVSGGCTDIATKALYSDSGGWHWGAASHSTAAIGSSASSSSYVGRRIWQAWSGGDRCIEDTIFTSPYLLPDQANWAACMNF